MIRHSPALLRLYVARHHLPASAATLRRLSSLQVQQQRTMKASLASLHPLLTSARCYSGGALPMASAMSPPVVPSSTTGARPSFLSGATLRSSTASPSALAMARRWYSIGRPTGPALSPKKSGDQLQSLNNIERYKEEEEEEQREETNEDPFQNNSGPGYLPFPAPFHTVNIIMFLFIANILCYLCMNFGNDDMRDFMVEHFTLSHENWHRIYPMFTNVIYQENLFQLLIDCWLLWQFGDTMLGFLGNTRMTFFAILCTLGGSLIHLVRQQFELYYGMDELEVRGRCYGANPFIMGLVSMEGLIFRHLNFIQQPPIPFLVLTAFVMVIDVWRIFTTKPEEHGAATGGALMAYLFWALPTRMLGLDKLTATL